MGKVVNITVVNKNLAEIMEKLMQANTPAEVQMENSRAAGVVMVAEAMGKMAMLEIGVSSHKNALLSTFVPQAIEAQGEIKHLQNKPNLMDEFFEHKQTRTV